MKIQLRQGRRIVGVVSLYMFNKILADLKRDGYPRAYEVLRSARYAIQNGLPPVPLTEADAKALHIASGASTHTPALLAPNGIGHFWYDAVIEAAP